MKDFDQQIIFASAEEVQEVKFKSVLKQPNSSLRQTFLMMLSLWKRDRPFSDRSHLRLAELSPLLLVLFSLVKLSIFEWCAVRVSWVSFPWNRDFLLDFGGATNCWGLLTESEQCRICILLYGLLSGVKIEVGSWCLVLWGLSPHVGLSPGNSREFFTLANNAQRFLIFRPQTLQMWLGRFSELLTSMPMDSQSEAKKTLRQPSLFEGVNRLSVEICQVLYLILKLVAEAVEIVDRHFGSRGPQIKGGGQSPKQKNQNLFNYHSSQSY